jgi:hypothetical protein
MRKFWAIIVLSVMYAISVGARVCEKPPGEFDLTETILVTPLGDTKSRLKRKGVPFYKSWGRRSSKGHQVRVGRGDNCSVRALPSDQDDRKWNIQLFDKAGRSCQKKGKYVVWVAPNCKAFNQIKVYKAVGDAFKNFEKMGQVGVASAVDCNTFGRTESPRKGCLNLGTGDLYKDPENCTDSECGIKNVSKPSRSFSALGICKNFDKYAAVFKKYGASVEALQQAFRYYQLHTGKFSKKIITVADYSLNSSKPRFFIVNLETGTIDPPVQVSHGSGKQDGSYYGDPDHPEGNLKACHRPGSNRKVMSTRTNMTRPGFFKTAELYLSKVCSNGASMELGCKKCTIKGRKLSKCPRSRISKGKPIPRRNWPLFNGLGKGRVNGMRMEGLTSGINSNARPKGVVMHEATYNTRRVMGRSYGCPAFKPGQGRGIMHKIRGGSLFYSFAPVCAQDMKDIRKDVPGWENTCIATSR